MELKWYMIKYKNLDLDIEMNSYTCAYFKLHAIFKFKMTHENSKILEIIRRK